MGEAREVSSTFLQQQIPTDFSCLKNILNCLPCNVDGITEKEGYFLVFELKHGEELSIGQSRMLKAWAGKPGCTILIINCRWTAPNAKNAREFFPESFSQMNASGELGEPHLTNVNDFAVRYAAWLRSPWDGAQPFTCSADEFAKKYVRLLPEYEQASALASIRKPDIHIGAK